MDSMDSKEARLRPPPVERFAGDSHIFDLNRALHDSPSIRRFRAARRVGIHQLLIVRRFFPNDPQTQRRARGGFPPGLWIILLIIFLNMIGGRKRRRQRGTVFLRVAADRRSIF